MAKNGVIAVLALLLCFVSYHLVRVENRHYALIVGMCRGVNDLPDLQCLGNVQTRTSWTWHLFYAVSG